MTSMWTAASDRDYYDPYSLDEEEPPERCFECGANLDRCQPCEEDCPTRHSGLLEDEEEWLDAEPKPNAA